MKSKIRKLVAIFLATIVATSCIVSGLSASASTSIEKLHTFRAYFYLKPWSGVTEVTNTVYTSSYQGYYHYVAGNWKDGNIGNAPTYTGTGGPIYGIINGHVGAVGAWSRSFSAITFNSPAINGGLLNTFTAHANSPDWSFSPSSSSAHVDIDYVMVGDINGDGVVDSNDFFALWRWIYLGDWSFISNFQAADVNGDGNIDNDDLLMLSDYLNPNSLVDRFE